MCFSHMVPKPKGDGDISQKDVIRIIGALKRSELEKSLCGKRLISWYNTQKRELSR